MRIYAKALLGAKTKIEKFVEKLGVVRITITKPENYMSPDSDYSVIEAQATSDTGTRYIYIYPKGEFWEKCARGDIILTSDSDVLPVRPYSSSNKRFAIGSIGNTPTGSYQIFFYDKTLNKNLYEIKLIWTNNI